MFGSGTVVMVSKAADTAEVLNYSCANAHSQDFSLAVKMNGQCVSIQFHLADVCIHVFLPC